jgi:DNA-binding MarR family transcriptional regulator
VIVTAEPGAAPTILHREVGCGVPAAEGLEQAAILLVRHLSDRAGLTLTAVMTLDTLDKEGPLRVTTLAESAGVSQPAMTQMIQRLERQGLVTRVDDPEDGRVALVSLSDAGRALRADHRRKRHDRLAALLTAVPAEDEAALNLAMDVALPIIRRLIDQASSVPHFDRPHPRHSVADVGQVLPTGGCPCRSHR